MKQAPRGVVISSTLEKKKRYLKHYSFCYLNTEYTSKYNKLYGKQFYLQVLLTREKSPVESSILLGGRGDE